MKVAPHVCADCGEEQPKATGVGPCPNCASLRVVPVSFVLAHFGPGWREECFPQTSSPPDTPPPTVESRIQIVSYGGGVNTIAMLVLLKRRGIVPHAIVMSDPGHEWPETYEYRDRVMQPWLLQVGFPKVVVVTREGEARYRPRARWKGTLGEACIRNQELPAAAYGMKGCSIKHKQDPMKWWCERQDWIQREWAAGRRVTKLIGYDIDEPKRVMKHRQFVKGQPVDTFSLPEENERYIPSYPVFDAGMDREACEALIASEGLPPVGKSACRWCPFNTFEEWKKLRDQHPEDFAYAVNISRLAAPRVDSPDRAGFLQCNPHGKRQLHVWADGGYDDQDLDKGTGIEEGKPCGCGD